MQRRRITTQYTFACGGFFRAGKDLSERFDKSFSACTFFFFFLTEKWRSAHTRQFHTLGQDESTVAQRARIVCEVYGKYCLEDLRILCTITRVSKKALFFFGFFFWYIFCLAFICLFAPCRKFWSLYLSKATAGARAALPISNSVYSIFLYPGKGLAASAWDL